MHRAPRNARVADLVGIHNRFQGVWEGNSPSSGRGRLRWLVAGTPTPGDPVLEVVDKGRIKPGQEVTWVLPGDGIELLDDGRLPDFSMALDALIADVRHLGETTIASLRLRQWPEVVLALSVSGTDQRRLVPGASVTVGLDLTKVHVMPRHASRSPIESRTLAPSQPT